MTDTRVGCVEGVRRGSVRGAVAVMIVHEVANADWTNRCVTEALALLMYCMDHWRGASSWFSSLSSRTVQCQLRHLCTWNRRGFAMTTSLISLTTIRYSLASPLWASHVHCHTDAHDPSRFETDTDTAAPRTPTAPSTCRDSNNLCFWEPSPNFQMLPNPSMKNLHAFPASCILRALQRYSVTFPVQSICTCELSFDCSLRRHVADQRDTRLIHCDSNTSGTRRWSGGGCQCFRKTTCGRWTEKASAAPRMQFDSPSLGNLPSGHSLRCAGAQCEQPNVDWTSGSWRGRRGRWKGFSKRWPRQAAKFWSTWEFDKALHRAEAHAQTSCCDWGTIPGPHSGKETDERSSTHIEETVWHEVSKRNV